MTKKTEQDQKPYLEARVRELETYIPHKPTIKVVLAIPSESQIKEIVRILPSNPDYTIKCLGNDNWYHLLERLAGLQKKPFQEVKESLPRAIFFPYDSSANAEMMAEMPFLLGNSQISFPVKDALEVCQYISLSKKTQYDAYPWLYVFSSEEIPHLTLQQSGVKKHFRTTDTGVLANELNTVIRDIFYRDLENERKKHFGSYRR